MVQQPIVHIIFRGGLSVQDDFSQGLCRQPEIFFRTVLVCVESHQLAALTAIAGIAPGDGILEQAVDGHAEDPRQGGQQRDVRRGDGLFPFRDSLAGDAENLSQRLL